MSKKNKLKEALAAEIWDDTKPELLYSRKIGKTKVRAVKDKYGVVELELLDADALGKKGWRSPRDREAKTLLLDLLAEVYDDD